MMNDLSTVLSQWDGRMTPVRKQMLSLFVKTRKPLSAAEVISSLSEKGFSTNKTTVYRALTAFCNKHILKEIKSVGESVYYELASLPHHHHLVCQKCGEMKEVNSEEVETSLSKVQQKAKQSGFTVTSHTLEFFGLCAGCI